MKKQGGSFTFHLASPVKGSCRGIRGRGRSMGQYGPAVPQADQTPPPLPAHPVSSPLATHAPQQSARTPWKRRANRDEERNEVSRWCAQRSTNRPTCSTGAARDPQVVSAPGCVRDSSVSGCRRTPTNNGSWGQHQQVPLKNRFVLSPGRLRSKNSLRASSSRTLSHPTRLDSTLNMVYALQDYARKLSRPTRSFTCSAEMAEFLVLRPPPRDRTLPQDFGKSTSVLPVFCSFGWRYTHRGTITQNLQLFQEKWSYLSFLPSFCLPLTQL